MSDLIRRDDAIRAAADGLFSTLPVSTVIEAVRNIPAAQPVTAQEAASVLLIARALEAWAQCARDGRPIDPSVVGLTDMAKTLRALTDTEGKPAPSPVTVQEAALIAENARLKEVVAAMAHFDGRKNNTHIREMARAALRALADTEGKPAPVAVQEAARVLLAAESREAVYDGCWGVVKVHRFYAILRALAATEGGAA